MKPKVFVCCGFKYGDTCQAIAILGLEYARTGIKPILVTTKGLLPILEGCTYIQPEIFKGEWQDLKGALLWAKRRFGEVICLSFHGKNWPVHKKTCSFQLDIYERGGVLSQFPLPLNLDNRSPDREKALVDLYTKDCRPYILVADHSESSPFDHSEALVSLLEEKFGVFYQIIRLSTVKAEKVYDLVGLYDKAFALVSIDTIHLHLSAASPIPVIALTTDKPELWHGTAWQSRFKAHIRYNDYEDRKGEIVEAIQDLIEGKSRPRPEITSGIGRYNPSVIEFEGQRLETHRYHHNPSFWRTQLAIKEGEVVSNIQPPKGFEEYSLEDGRLFIHKGKLHINYVVACAPDNIFKCAMQYGELEKTDLGWIIINNFQPMHGANDFRGTEKNWVFFSDKDKLYCIYQHAPEQLVLEIERDIVINEYRTVSPVCPFGLPRGGTQPIPHGDGRWLRFFHVQENKFNDRTRIKYHMGALVMESKPPFQIKKVSQKPILSGNEQYFPNWKFWKWNVAIPYGAIKDEDGWLCSVGINDSVCGVLRFEKKDLML